MNPREPYAWAIGAVAVWIAVVLVIVLAADGADPTVEAGTIVMLLPIGAFLLGGSAGVRGRDRHWVTRLSITMGVLLALAYLVQVLVRTRFDAVYLVPLIAALAGLVLWVAGSGGWLLGMVVRHGLGLGDTRQRDEGFL